MLIEMYELACSPDGHMYPGKIYDVPKKLGEQLCKPGPHGKAYARPAPRGSKPTEVAKAANPDDEGDE